MKEPVTIAEHEKWMYHCLKLGRQALLNGDPPVGSIIVQAGKLLGEGIEAGKSKKDITCHAEIEAIRQGLKKTPLKDLSGCSLYSTHEPCLMCSYVIRHYKVSWLVIGTSVPAVGGYSSNYPLLTGKDIPIWSEPPQIIEGVLKEACQALTREYEQKNNK